MVKIKNLDLRELIPFERHSKIFDMWNSLKGGETLRIINDHEPKPLYYMFQAEHKGEFEWGYEEEGPEDWIFTIKRISDKIDRKQEIKDLIKQLKTQEDVSILKEKAKDILKNLSPTELGIIEQEIIEEGTTRKEMRKLCDVHLEVMKDGLGKVEMNLNPGHPIHTLMEEHKMILEFIDKLKRNIEEIETAKSFDDIPEELEMLKHIAKHLVEADKHHQREEEVLFPELEKRGITEPPEIMKEEHEELIPKKEELYNLTENYDSFKYSEFLTKVRELAKYIIENLPDHIYKEDNILYPMAIQAIPEKEWSRIKNKCDEIGYCCFTPKC
ncbi:MAG: DUF438 domain-containing protein [Nanoarchaeota archaeon]